MLCELSYIFNPPIQILSPSPQCLKCQIPHTTVGKGGVVAQGVKMLARSTIGYVTGQPPVPTPGTRLPKENIVNSITYVEETGNFRCRRSTCL